MKRRMDFKWSLDYLNKVLEAKRKVEIQNKKLDDLRAEMCSIKGAGYEERITGIGNNAVEDKMIEYIALRDEYMVSWIDSRAYQLKIQEEAIERIMLLRPGRCREFLLRRYVYGISEPEIAIEFGYVEDSSIYHLRKRALEKFERMATARGWKNK